MKGIPVTFWSFVNSRITFLFKTKVFMSQRTLRHNLPDSTQWSNVDRVMRLWWINVAWTWFHARGFCNAFLSNFLSLPCSLCLILENTWWTTHSMRCWLSHRVFVSLICTSRTDFNFEALFSSTISLIRGLHLKLSKVKVFGFRHENLEEWP